MYEGGRKGGEGGGQVTASLIWQCGMLYIGWLFVHEHSVVYSASWSYSSFLLCVSL